jgi:hypothetical protein
MTAVIMRRSDLPFQPGHTTSGCVGCEFFVKGQNCAAACSLEALRQNLDNPGSYYYFDPLVYATNRLKGLV